MKLFGNQKGLAPLIIIVIIFLTVAAGVLIINNNKIPKNSTVIPAPLPVPMNTQSPGTAPALPLSSYMSYAVPKGWKEEPDDPYPSGGSTQIKSPDFTPSPLNNTETGVLINISFGRNSSAELEEHNNYHFPGEDDFTYTTVGGFKALRYHIDYEGHFLVYEIEKDGDFCKIMIITRDLKTENKYRGLIDAFIQSIKFK